MQQRGYLYRDGKEIRIAHVDAHGALTNHQRGYELGERPYDTREEAEEARMAWREISRFSGGLYNSAGRKTGFPSRTRANSSNSWPSVSAWRRMRLNLWSGV
jgi:hypothetical protein